MGSTTDSSPLLPDSSAGRKKMHSFSFGYTSLLLKFVCDFESSRISLECRFSFSRCGVESEILHVWPMMPILFQG